MVKLVHWHPQNARKMKSFETCLQPRLLHFSFLEEKITSFTQSEGETLVKLKKTVEIAENIELCKQYFQVNSYHNYCCFYHFLFYY